MAVICRDKQQSILNGWDVTSYVQPGAQMAAVIVYDTQQDVFHLIPCAETPIRRRVTQTKGEDKLSLRELQILQLVAAGFDNREVAAKLNIRLNTVKVHLQSIFARLKVTTRSEAVARAFHDGWICFPRTVCREKTP